MLFDSRQVNLERSSLPFLRVNGDVTIALFHHPVNCGQAQTRSFIASLGGEKGFENLRLDFQVYSRARVRDGQHYVLAWDRTLMLSCKSRIKFCIPCLDGQSTSIWHCITCVDSQTHDHLFDLSGVRFDLADNRVKVQIQLNVFPD